MEGKQFSSSRGVVIYVRDVLERYQPDALRYFISAAGPGEPGQRLHLGGVRPPHQRRAGRRLGQPGQPHRDDDRQELRRDPAGRRADGRATRRCSTPSRRRSARVGELIGRHRQKAALAEAMRTVAEVNKYVSDSAPWKLKGDDERERLAHDPARHRAGGRRLQPAARAVPAAQRERRRRVLGGAGDVAPMPEIREVDDLDGGPAYPILTGDYSGFPAWERRPVVPGTPVEKPAPVFTKLDPSVVDEELARLAGQPA